MELVENPFVSDFTKKTLRQFGWKDKDAIPADLGGLLLKIKESLPPSSNVDVLVDIAALSPEQVAKVTELLSGAKKQHEKQQQNDKMAEATDGMADSVRAAYEKAMSAAGPMIVDDRQAPAAAEEPAPTVTPAAPDAPPAETAAEFVSDTGVTGGIDVLPFCPRCGWDMRMKFEVVPTTRDKEDFLATLLGGARFKRTYELMGGNIIVTFRGLMAEENKLIYRQLLLDQNENKVTSETEWFVQMMDYRLACSLDTITNKTGKVLSVMPELREMPFTADPANPLFTPLAAQLEYMSKNILAQEVTRRLVATHLRQFQRLIEALEAMALDPSFWNGIE